MTEPLRLTFEVACPVSHAFAVWTSRIGTWWPQDHTVSGRDDARVTLEGHVGGRIVERLPDGVEHVWGEVTVWEPPRRLGYAWHIGRDQSAATDVEVRFSASGEHTRVDIEQSGWERLGGESEALRTRNRGGWEALTSAFRAAAENSVVHGEEH